MSDDVVCAAGRTAFLGGAPSWRMPCVRPLNGRIHVIVALEDDDAQIMLCDFHYQEAEDAGKVTVPNPSQEQVDGWALRRNGRSGE